MNINTISDEVKFHSKYRKEQIEEDKKEQKLEKKKKGFIIFGISLGITILILSVSIYFLRRKKKKQKAVLK